LSQDPVALVTEKRDPLGVCTARGARSSRGSRSWQGRTRPRAERSPSACAEPTRAMKRTLRVLPDAEAELQSAFLYEIVRVDVAPVWRW